MSFIGEAVPLTVAGVNAAISVADITLTHLWTIMSVETKGAGYLDDKRPVILYERHIFHNLTGGEFSREAPDISSKAPGGYGQGGEHQYERLERAIALDRLAALKSTSWGLGQIMGTNCGVVSDGGVEDFVAECTHSEDLQLMHIVNYIRNVPGALVALRDQQWAKFARLYNGPNYQKNSYDIKLKQDFYKWSGGPLPDLQVRAAQIALRRLGYHPGTVDGFMGRMTISALHEFQADSSIPARGTLNSQTLELLGVRI